MDHVLLLYHVHVCVCVKLEQQGSNYLYHYFRGLMRPSMSIFTLHVIDNYYLKETILFFILCVISRILKH